MPTYITDNNILVRIPTDGPTEVTNTVTLVTASGNRVTVDFETVLPPPLILQLYNEYAKPGTENRVLGLYFFDVQKVLIGNQEVEILARTSTAITFKMPESVGQDSVTVVAAGGTTVSAFRLNETVGNMVNFDIPATTWGSDVCWGDAERINPEDSDIEPVAGRYTHPSGRPARHGLPGQLGYLDMLFRFRPRAGSGFGKNLPFRSLHWRTLESWNVCYADHA